MVQDTDLRKLAWENYIDFPEFTKNLCFCCRQNEIHILDHELGHIVAKVKMVDREVWRTSDPSV